MHCRSSPLCPALQPGDAIILNAPNSIVGRTLLQLAKLLKLRAVAVLRCRTPPGSAAGVGGADSEDARFNTVAEQLKALGATLVVKDEGSVKVRSACLRALCLWRIRQQLTP